MQRSTVFTALALSLFSVTAAAQGQQDSTGDARCFNGYAYTLKGGEYRYTEHHEQHLTDGRIKTWDVTYVDRDGKTMATKHMDFSDNPTVPVYTMKIAADGYAEGIRHDDDGWTMFRRDSSNAKEVIKGFEIDPPMAGDSGFHPLIQEKFGDLMDGQTIPFKFVAAGRQGVINLKAHKTGTTTFEGRQAVVFDAELDMFLINYFVDSLKLTYDPDSKRLLEYRGIGNMHDDRGKVYPVRVTYASEMPDVARKNDAPAASCGTAGGNG